MKNNTKTRYLKKSDLYNYFADKILVNHWALTKIKRSKFKGKSIYYPPRRIWINFHSHGTSKKGTRISFTSGHNLNRIARFWGMQHYNFVRTGSDFTHSDNFIPYNLRKAFKENHFTTTNLRSRVVDLLIKELNVVDTEVRNFLYKKFNVSNLPICFNRSICKAEIIYDIESLSPVEFAKDQNIIQAMQQETCSNRSRQYINNDDYSFSSNSALFHKIETGQEGGIDILFAELSDRSRIKIYKKEQAKNIILNRNERTFSSNHIKKYTGRRRFNNKQELDDMLYSLAKVTFEAFRPILNIPMKFNDELTLKIIKNFCIAYFGKHGLSAFEDLTTGDCCIRTGKDGKSLNAVKYKARDISKKNNLLKMKRRGVYVINWKKIKSIRINQATESSFPGSLYGLQMIQ